MKNRWIYWRTKFWNNRPADERRALTVAFALLLPIIYYFLLWQPAHLAVGKLSKILPTLQSQLTKMHDQAAEVESLHHRPESSTLDSAALKSSLIDSLARHQMSAMITSIELQEPNGVRISCDAISFSTLIAWLHNLEKEQHIRTDSISVTPLVQTGMVKISATLSNRNSK